VKTLGLLLFLQGDPALFFEEKIRPLLAARCIGCHGDAKVSGLRLDSREGFLSGGRKGPALVPGDAERSLFLQAVGRTHETLKMPPGEKLPSAEIEALRAWVKMGAPYPSAKLVRTTGKVKPADREWWSFRPLAKASGSIDAFIARKLTENDLKPVALADRRTLLRRLSFDLTGLPPGEDSGEPYEAVVERMLNSRHFGERWGRFWLDVARYSEDDFLGLSQEKYANAWRYRDWVVEAFNKDLPYDTFVKAQIAADLMGKTEYLPALGFFGLGPWQYSVSPPPQARADERHDRIDVVTRGFLGLTGACSRCHDHKFDPITTRDYYGLAGVFGSTEYREYPLAPREVVEKYEKHQAAIREKEKQIRDFLDRQREQLGEILASQTARYLRGTDPDLNAAVAQRWKQYLAQPDKDQPLLDGNLTPERVQSLVLEVMAEKKEIDEEKRQAVERSRPKKGGSKTRLPNGFETYDEFCPGCDLAVRAMERDRYMLWQELFRDPSKERAGGVLYFSGKELEQLLSGEWKRHVGILREELGQLKKTAPPAYPYLHGVGDKDRTANLRIALRGDPYTLGDETPRRFLEVLSPVEPEIWTSGSGRLQLAEAIARQPIAARVMANRVWMWIFGRGLVASASNFGKYGDRPTHPELLEYLAAKFAERGYSVKALAREIVMSETYRRASSTDPRNAAIDGANKWYWRGIRKRLDAEALRDAMLAVSGILDGRIGGPSEDLNAACKRRTIYGKVSRFRLSEPLQLFDFPSPATTSEKRVVTHVPLQRLFFLNSEIVTRQAAALALRLEREGGTVDAAYRIVFGRAAREEERTLGDEFQRENGWKQYAQVLLSSNEFLFVD
jgi:hypothetical protein